MCHAQLLSGRCPKKYYEHLHGLCNKSVRQWIKELRKLDTSPVLHVLEIVHRQAGTSFEEFMRVVCDKEADWIDAYIRLGTLLLNRDGITKRYRRAFGKPRKSIREETVAATGCLPQVVPSTNIVASTANFPAMRLEDFRIDVAKLTRQQLSVLSAVSVSTIQRAEEGESISRLMIARILDGLSKQLGKTVTRDEIDEFQ
jgi:hypothetical protein